MNPIRKTTTVFQPVKGGTVECHTILQVTDSSLSFLEQMNCLLDSYQYLFENSKLKNSSESLTNEGKGSYQPSDTNEEAVLATTPIFRRFFLSDAANQQSILEDALGEHLFCATSIVQQPPLNGTKIALWVYSADQLITDEGTFQHNGYTHYWMGGCLPMSRCGIKDLNKNDYLKGNSEYQMRDIFDAYRSELKPMEMTIEDNCLRTWIFVRDVDVNYKGIVTGRKNYFGRIGLTPKTHFIASTGIEGQHSDSQVLVQMDACATKGLKKEQIQYLQAKSHLNPTSDYGVTFERGTAITYGDRCQIYISGTASIDNNGEVMHQGDICKQTMRMLENIQALLSEADASLKDIKMAIVYLRDIADAETVTKLFDREMPNLNYILVNAAVCRPAWLIEMECIALREAGNNDYAFF